MILKVSTPLALYQALNMLFKLLDAVMASSISITAALMAIPVIHRIRRRIRAEESDSNSP